MRSSVRRRHFPPTRCSPIHIRPKICQNLLFSSILVFCVIRFFLVSTDNDGEEGKNHSRKFGTMKKSSIPSIAEQNKRHISVSSKQNDQRLQIRPRRLVILGGPHKSASSSTQEFFFRHATGGKEDPRRRRTSNNDDNQTDIALRNTLKDWIWPFHPKKGRYTSRKAFAILVKEMPSPILFQQDTLNVDNRSSSIITAQQKKREMTELVYRSIERSIFVEHPLSNVILGSEEFDRFGSTPYSHRQGLLGISNLIERISSNKSQPPQLSQGNPENRNKSHTSWVVDVVVAYRRPRSDHWFSIWREIAPRARGGVSSLLQPYGDWICSSSSSSKRKNPPKNTTHSTASPLFDSDPYHHLELWEYLDAVANPLHYALALLEHDPDFTIHIMDMSGLEKFGIDINHGIVCNVLLGLKLDENVNVIDGRNNKVLESPATSLMPLSCNLGHGTDNESNNGPQMLTNSSSGAGVIVRANQKSGDPGVTLEQKDEIEFLLRMRDCDYRQRLESFVESGRLIIHFGDTMWDECHRTTTKKDGDQWSQQNRPPWNVSSTDDLLYLLQDQLGCHEDTFSKKRHIGIEIVRKYRHGIVARDREKYESE